MTYLNIWRNRHQIYMLNYYCVVFVTGFCWCRVGLVRKWQNCKIVSNKTQTKDSVSGRPLEVFLCLLVNLSVNCFYVNKATDKTAIITKKDLIKLCTKIKMFR